MYIVALWTKKSQNVIKKSTSKKTTQGVFSDHKLKRQGSKLKTLWLSLRSLQHKLTINAHSWFRLTLDKSKQQPFVELA